MPLSLEDKIGQMLLFGWDNADDDYATQINSHTRFLIDELRVGGVILMERNVGAVEQTRSMLFELQHLAAARELPPLFVSTDQEGGRVARFGPPNYQEFPSARCLGGFADPSKTTLSSAEMGSVLKRSGVNWALMPVLDVSNNPNNMVIGDRSFGESPSIVSAMGRAAIGGMQDVAGVMACGKHFPGHGDTSVDSHFDLPVIDRNLKSLYGMELLPFQAAIDAGVSSIMTSHILFPALDPALPATLSPAILTELLRKQMRFDGIIVTDCLEMAGVSKKWGSAEAAVLAVLAGADILLACHTLSTQIEIRNALLSAVKSGRLPECRVDDANERIAKAKSRWVSRKVH
jgi:beta-N-acetylhexosaminidase